MHAHDRTMLARLGFADPDRREWYRPIDTDFYVYPGRNGVMGICRRCAVEKAMEAKRRRKARHYPANEKTPALAGAGKDA